MQIVFFKKKNYIDFKFYHILFYFIFKPHVNYEDTIFIFFVNLL
jgi:hypothetical protein